MTARLLADLLVVGLGPAGASAAAVAAKAGIRVIAVDRRRVAGLPVQCAEFVPGPLASAVDDLAQTTRQAIGAMHTQVGKGPAHRTPEFCGAMIDRARFDQMLVAAAVKAGASVVNFGASVAAVDEFGALLSDGRRIDCPIIIGADGPRSLVGKAIGSINHELVETRQITVRLHKPFAATDIFLSPDYRGGYAWLFPKGDVAHVGLGLDPDIRRELKPLLGKLHATLVEMGRVDVGVLSLTGGAIPVGGLLRAHGRIGDRAVMLAGDAAGTR